MNSARAAGHVALFLFACLAIYVIHFFVSHEQLMQTLSISTAFTSLLFFSITLSIGPINLFFSRRIPLSINLRRDFGIWSGITALVHTVLGLLVHFDGKFLYYFIYPPGKPQVFPVRYDAFGLTNHLGLACTLMMVILLFLSNNRAIQKLGPVKWKKWQRLSYFLLLAIPAHGLVYQVLEKRLGWYTLSMFVIVFGALFAQSAGVMHYRNHHSD